MASTGPSADDVRLRTFVAAAFGGVAVWYAGRAVQAARAEARLLDLPRKPRPLWMCCMSIAETAAFGAVVGSWAGPLDLRSTDAGHHLYGVFEPVGNVAARAAQLATAGWREACADASGSAGLCVAVQVGMRIASPGSSSAHGAHELNVTEGGASPHARLVEYAKRFENCTAVATCHAALCIEPSRVRQYSRSTTGRICGPEQVPPTAASMEDLFVPDDSSSMLFPLLSQFMELSRLESHAELPRLGRNLPAVMAANTISNLGHGANGALLTRPYRWQTYLDVGYALMYEDLAKTLDPTLQSPTHRIAVNAMGALRRVPAALMRIAASVKQAATMSTASTAAERAAAERAALGYDAQSPLCGRFENHVTIHLRTDASAGTADAPTGAGEKLMRVADALRIKVVSIALPRGSSFPEQVMTSFYTHGTVRACTKTLFEFASLMALLGFTVTRVKLELQLTECLTVPCFRAAGTDVGLCPLSDDDAKDRRVMSPRQYYEFHVKISVPESKVAAATPPIRAVCATHGAHLSKNAFKVYADGNAADDASTPEAAAQQTSASGSMAAAERQLLYFLTLRKYATGFRTCLTQLHALQAEAEAALAPHGGRLLGTQREYSVLDTNTGLDDGWVDRSEPTPSFMLAAP